MKAVGFILRYRVLWILLVIGLMNPGAILAQALQKGGQLPSIVLQIPKSTEEKAYLGLSGSGTFKIPQIKADVVIIEIFSMYCPFCQKDAPENPFQTTFYLVNRQTLKTEWSKKIDLPLLNAKE